MSFKPNYIENNETKILDPKTSEKKKEIFLILPMERKNRKKKKKKEKKEKKTLPLLMAGLGRRKVVEARLKMKDGQRSPLVSEMGEIYVGMREMGEC
jgi:hypothetical protein